MDARQASQGRHLQKGARVIEEHVLLVVRAVHVIKLKLLCAILVEHGQLAQAAQVHAGAVQGFGTRAQGSDAAVNAHGPLEALQLQVHLQPAAVSAFQGLPRPPPAHTPGPAMACLERRAPEERKAPNLRRNLRPRHRHGQAAAGRGKASSKARGFSV